MFRSNVGPLDRALRVALGIALLSLTIVGPETAWGYVGLIPLATGLMGTCALYSLLGINTRPRRFRG